MKLFKLILSTVVVLSISSIGYAMDFDKRYGLKSFIAEYEVTGEGMGAPNGTETVYADQNGAIEARHTDLTIEVMGFKQETKGITILQDGKSSHYDSKSNTIMQIDLDELKESTNKSFQNLNSDEAIVAMGGEKVGFDTHLGKKCERIAFSQFGGETCIYKGVPLKYTMDNMGIKVEYIAKSFKENVKIPKDKITLPSDAKVQQAPDLSEIFGQMNTQQQGNVSKPSIQEFDQEEMKIKMEEMKKAMEDAGPEAQEALNEVFNN